MAIKFEFVPEPWPNFSEAQVSFLEKQFPARCIGTMETVEAHVRYAGKVDLIAQLREHVIGSPTALALTDDEEAALDDMAREIALAPNNNNERE